MQENTYFMNPEDAAEMARLSLQDLLLTKADGRSLPGYLSPRKAA